MAKCSNRECEKTSKADGSVLDRCSRCHKATYCSTGESIRKILNQASCPLIPRQHVRRNTGQLIEDFVPGRGKACHIVILPSERDSRRRTTKHTARSSTPSAFEWRTTTVMDGTTTGYTAKTTRFLCSRIIWTAARL